MSEFEDLAATRARLGVGDGMRASRQELRTADGGVVSLVVWTPEARPDDGPEFVLLHGVGNDARSFDGLALALGRPAVAVDLPGHGRSSWRPDADYSPGAVAGTVVEALRRVVRRPVVLVGHSLGAMTAARVAAVAPDLVGRLVLVDMTPDFPDRALERLVAGLAEEPPFGSPDEYVAYARAIRPGEPLDTFVAEGRHAFVSGDAGLRRRHHFAHLPHAAAATLGSFASVWPDLEAHPGPVLLVRGERGYVSPRLAQAFVDRLPDATVATAPTRHGVHTTDPLALAAAIETWLPATGWSGARG